MPDPGFSVAMKYVIRTIGEFANQSFINIGFLDFKNWFMVIEKMPLF
jgi:hypothetical protein